MHWKYLFAQRLGMPLAVTLCAAACGEVTPPHETQAAPVTERAGPLASADPRIQGVLDYMRADLRQFNVPGGALALVVDGQLVHTSGLGVREAGTPLAVDGDTVFRVASVTKTLTAATLVELQSRGKLSLSANLIRYAPDFTLYPGQDPSSFTLRQLLTHTAGLADAFEFTCAGSLTDFFRQRPTLTQWSPAGRLWNYTNLGFSAAGLAAERALGKPYPDVVEETLFAPLQMSTATFDPEEVRARDNYARAHPGPGQLDDTFTRCDGMNPNGYAYASARDLGRFVEAFVRGSAPGLHPLTLPTLRIPQVSTLAPTEAFYNQGVFTWAANGVPVYFHPGDLFGFHAFWLAVPDRGFGVAVMINGESNTATRVALKALRDFTGLQLTTQDAALPPAAWTQFVGTYDDPIEPGSYPGSELGLVSVEIVGDGLYGRLLSAAGQPAFRLIPIYRDYFLWDFGGTFLGVTFFRDAQGRPESLVTRAGVGRRVSPLRASELAAQARAAPAPRFQLPHAPPMGPEPLLLELSRMR
jgi:CubicO group peptidase (beta-lactamase class C family)